MSWKAVLKELNLNTSSKKNTSQGLARNFQLKQVKFSIVLEQQQKTKKQKNNPGFTLSDNIKKSETKVQTINRKNPSPRTRLNKGNKGGSVEPQGFMRKKYLITNSSDSRMDAEFPGVKPFYLLFKKFNDCTIIYFRVSEPAFLLPNNCEENIYF